MEAFNLFWQFAKTSGREVLDEKKTYLYSFLALMFLDNIETIYPMFGVGEETNTFFGLSIIGTLLAFVVLSQVVLVQKRKRGGDGELKYFVPTFLLYSLYYSFLFFGGLLLLVIPGFYVLFYFSMLPFVAVLDDHSDGRFFQKSRQLVRLNLPLIVCVSLLNLFVDVAGLLITPFKDPVAKIILKFIFSIPDAFFTLVMTVATVKVYYYLNDQLTTATEKTQISE